MQYDVTLAQVEIIGPALAALPPAASRGVLFDGVGVLSVSAEWAETVGPIVEAVLSGVAPVLPPARVPDEVTDLQFRLALNAEGLRDAAESYVAAAAWDVRDWWDRATHIRRDDARLNAAVKALGKTDADRDALFTLAASL